jgi:serine/threonine protein kinase
VYHASKVEEIYKEAKALKKLDHPNIIKLYHAILWKNFVVLIMEFVAGGELLSYVKAKGPNGLSESESHMFFQQITEAVCYCHNNSIIHRDLKPENILLTSTESKQIKIIDFGIAGNNNVSGKDTTEAGSIFVLSPEALIAACVQAVPTIDIWAMGIILYFLVCGKLPFFGQTRAEVVTKITKNPVKFPEKKWISAQCKTLINALLNKNPKKRITMNEIYQAEWYAMSYLLILLIYCLEKRP